MAVTCLIRRASDNWIEFLLQLRDPKEIARLAFAPEEARAAPQPPKPPPGFWAKLFARPPRDSEQACLPEADVLDLYKSWHGLHFLLTGQAQGGEWPLGFMWDATPVGDESTGVSVLTSQHTRELAEALSRVTLDDLRARYDPARMQGLAIYPGGWEVEPEDETLQFFGERLEELKTFVAGTAGQGRALVLVIG